MFFFFPSETLPVRIRTSYSKTSIRWFSLSQMPPGETLLEHFLKQFIGSFFLKRSTTNEFPIDPLIAPQMSSKSFALILVHHLWMCSGTEIIPEKVYWKMSANLLQSL